MKVFARTQFVNNYAITEIDNCRIITEPPIAEGGSGQYLPATRLFLAALLNCEISVLHSFCLNRGIPTDQLVLQCEAEMDQGKYKEVKLKFELPLEFPDKYRAALRAVINTCAVESNIRSFPEIEVAFDS